MFFAGVSRLKFKCSYKSLHAGLLSMLLLSSADFFFKINCLKNLSGILSECETVWIQIRTDECQITNGKNIFSLSPGFYCMSCLGCPSLKKKPDFQDNGKNSRCLSRILRTS